MCVYDIALHVEALFFKIFYLCIRVHMHAYVYVCACMRV